MQVGILLLIAATARAVANTDSNSTSPTALLSTAPACAYGKCTAAGVTDCVCTSVPLQARVSQCVQQACEFPDQIATVHVTQKLCRGYPKQQRRRYSYVFSVALPSLTTVIVALRCMARIKVTKKLWWDDGTALIALAFLIVISGLGLANFNLGYGSHYWDIDPNNGKAILKIFYAQQMVYIFVQTFAKASIACFCSRVFTNKRFQLVIKFFMVFLFTHGFMFLMLLVFQCRPIQSNWDRFIKGQCFNVTAIVYAGAACSILEDVFLIVLPIPELLKLQLNPKKRGALVFMFALGSFACVASVIRLQYLVAFADSYDSTYEQVSTVTWSAVELNLAIICGSLPSLRPLFKKVPVLLSTAKSAARKGASNRQSRERSVTANVKYQVSHYNSVHSSPASTPHKPELPRDFGSASTAYDKHSHVALEETIETDITEEFVLEDMETGRKN
ncbi:integral membrane protein [Colletotrichum cereale]|nr:integral membrane protein [Colletotrichum cereale]